MTFPARPRRAPVRVRTPEIVVRLPEPVPGPELDRQVAVLLEWLRRHAPER